MTLRYYGVRRIADAISEDNALTAYLGQRVDDADDFELLARPELSICCFRYVPSTLRSASHRQDQTPSAGIDSELDELNTKIMHTVQRGGRAYLSSATITGRFALRTCITNFRTTRADIDETLEIIREAGREICGSAA
jgi:glutamate/tyrosine decarboxylase-like PLP-dependent enzyme